MDGKDNVNSKLKKRRKKKAKKTKIITMKALLSCGKKKESIIEWW